MLVSAVCLRLQSEESRLTWAPAGHPPSLCLPQPAGAGAAWLDLPARSRTDLTLGNAEAELSSGQGVFVYADGATYAGAGERLGLDGLLRRLRPLGDWLRPLAGLPAEAVVRQAEKAILEWAGTLCLLAMKPA